MFQHASPWKFNPLNRGCIYCVSLFLPEHFQPCWSPSRHQNTAGIAQMPARLLPGTSFGQRNSFGNSESGWGFLPLSALHPLLSSSPILAKGMGPSQIELILGKFLCPPPQWARNSSCTPPCIPAPQIPWEWGEFEGAELSQPLPAPLGAAALGENKEPVQTLQLGWRGCRVWGYNSLEGTLGTSLVGKKKLERKKN